MLGLALGFGFSGYLLPWNELSYYATLVGTKIPDAIPVFGGFVMHFLRGGEQVTVATLTRFYAFHVVVLPLALGGLLAVHLLLVQVQGMSLPLGMPSEKVRDHRPFFSEFLLIDGCAWPSLIGAIATLAVFLPAEIGRKADALTPAPEGIKPEWYFLFLFKTLKLVPEGLGVAAFAIGASFFVVLPFLDRNAAREERSPRFTAVFLIALLYAATFEVLAWLDPGTRRAPEALTAPTNDLSRSVVNLLMLWVAIGFLLLYLQKLPAHKHLHPEAVRSMKIHEYQAKQIFARGRAWPCRGASVADTPQAAAEAFAALGGRMAVVKAQIHAGGRGKGTIADNPRPARRATGPQPRRGGKRWPETCSAISWSPSRPGPEGRAVHRVLVEEGCPIARELYLGVVVDRASGRPVLIASSEGGMDIEQWRPPTPEAHLYASRSTPTPGSGQLPGPQDLPGGSGLPAAPSASAEGVHAGAWAASSSQHDCSLLEINPLVLTADDRLVALDAKMSFDDNALFRHPELAELRDLAEEEPAEVRAGEAGLSYVKLDGNIGCLVNGAGLAMSTMDMIKLHGGEPANFLDVGGGANVAAGDRGLPHPGRRSRTSGRCWSTSSAASCVAPPSPTALIEAYQLGRLQRAAGGAAGRDRGRAGPPHAGRERPRTSSPADGPDRRRQKSRRGRTR